MNHNKKELFTSITILSIAAVVLLLSVLAIRNHSKEQSITGNFVYDTGCYGLMYYGKLSCYPSNIGKQCTTGCYVANTPNGKNCDCLPE